MRTSNLELPDAEELVAIMRKESPRLAVRRIYYERDATIFGTYRQLTNARWIDEYPTMELIDVLQECAQTTRQLATKILDDKVARADIDELYDSLAIGMSPEMADAIFVFGSPANRRIERAAELYKQGFAKRLIVSGYGPHYGANVESEAERTRNYALSQGVPSEDIITEARSITLPDNVKRTLDEMELMHWQPKKLLIVATRFVLRRAVYEWQKFTPWDIEVLPVDVHTAPEHTERSSWFATTPGVTMLLSEYAKLVIENKMDLIRQSSMDELSTV